MVFVKRAALASYTNRWWGVILGGIQTLSALQTPWEYGYIDFTWSN